GHPRADAVAALFVAVLVLPAAGRLRRRNVDVLMDRVPAEAQEAATAAISRLRPAVELRRLRMRQAAGRHFADVVIGVPPGAAIEQGHAAADAVEEAVERALPESDVVVHVEPQAADDAIRERAQAAAMRAPSVRAGAALRALRFLRTEQGLVAFLTLGLDPSSPLSDAHDRASRIEEEIRRERPDIADVVVHTEP